MKKYILIFASIGIFNIYSIKAQVNGAILQGNGVTASGQYSSAIGNQTQATGLGSFAGGRESVATKNYTMAFGNFCQATGHYAISLGSASIANADNAISIGVNTTASGLNAMSFGQFVKATGTNSIALGRGYLTTELTNGIANSFVVSFNSTNATLFVGPNNSGVSTGTGNIGVATTSPGSKLQVNGNAAIGYSGSTAAPANGLLIAGATGIGITTPGSTFQVNGNSAIGYSNSTAAPANGLLISGNTGIGTATVGSKLQINGNAAIGYSSSTAAPANGLLINGNLGIGTTAAATTEKLTVNGKVKTNAIVLPDGEINSFATLNLWNMNGNDIFRLNGKVGIGTNTPTSTLTLRGISPDILLSNNNNDENDPSDFRILSSNGAGRLICSGDMAVFLDAQNTHEIESFQIFANCDFYGTPAQCPNIKQLFVVTNSGSSINTNLNINGNMMLYDDGRIWAKEIKVALNNPWSDFVFDKDYKLRSLSEVEAFVNTHKHLPDVPSAAEVEKNGIDLAEMNKILLQKIEELTLYVIELQKQINENKK